MVSTISIRTSRIRPVMPTPGLLFPTSYLSPRFGYKVRWGTPWVIRDEAGPDSTSDDPVTDRIVLYNRESGRSEVQIVGASRCNLLDSGETIRFWSSDLYLSEFMDPGTMVVLAEATRTAGAVVLVSHGLDGGSDIVTVKEALEVDHRTSVRVTFTADLSTFPDTYREMRQSLQVGHHGLLRFFSDDVLQAVLS